MKRQGRRGNSWRGVAPEGDRGRKSRRDRIAAPNAAKLLINMQFTENNLYISESARKAEEVAVCADQRRAMLTPSAV
jgi:hypothetical protein